MPGFQKHPTDERGIERKRGVLSSRAVGPLPMLNDMSTYSTDWAL